MRCPASCQAAGRVGQLVQRLLALGGIVAALTGVEVAAQQLDGQGQIAHGLQQPVRQLRAGGVRLRRRRVQQLRAASGASSSTRSTRPGELRPRCRWSRVVSRCTQLGPPQRSRSAGSVPRRRRLSSSRARSPIASPELFGTILVLGDVGEVDVERIRPASSALDASAWGPRPAHSTPSAKWASTSWWCARATASVVLPTPGSPSAESA